MTDVELQKKTKVSWKLQQVMVDTIFTKSWTTTVLPKHLKDYDDVWDWIDAVLGTWKKQGFVHVKFHAEERGWTVPWEQVRVIEYTTKTVEID